MSVKTVIRNCFAWPPKQDTDVIGEESIEYIDLCSSNSRKNGKQLLSMTLFCHNLVLNN